MEDKVLNAVVDSHLKETKSNDKQKIKRKVVDLGPTLLITTLNVNSYKCHLKAEIIRFDLKGNVNLTICCLDQKKKKKPFKYKDESRLKVKEWPKIPHQCQLRKVNMVILTNTGENIFQNKECCRNK